LRYSRVTRELILALTIISRWNYSRDDTLCLVQRQ